LNEPKDKQLKFKELNDFGLFKNTDILLFYESNNPIGAGRFSGLKYLKDIYFQGIFHLIKKEKGRLAGNSCLQ
jgi:hypothetical protein